MPYLTNEFEDAGNEKIAMKKNINNTAGKRCNVCLNKKITVRN